MFSANENIMLRKHKRRIIDYIESTIPESVLELGTSVMVMQVSCQQPGCVPLETAITVVFPKPPTKKTRKPFVVGPNESTNDKIWAQEDETQSFPLSLLPNLEESRIGGSFKTRILKPLSDVTLDDVMDALPPSFEGGRRTTESLCLRARDMMFAQIGQLADSDDTSNSKQGRRLIAEYLQICLGEYVERGCVAPEWGEGFTSLGGDEKEEDALARVHIKKDRNNETASSMNNASASSENHLSEGNLVLCRQDDESKSNK